jgi:peptidoglycan/xylan/chitin deacetylase (PgdA/CDA1 family)
MKKRNLLIFTIILLLATSCTAGENSTSEVESGQNSSESSLTSTMTREPTPTRTLTATPTITPTSTITLTPTITPTSWPLSSFESSLLLQDVDPVSYIEDTCEYLEKRRGEGKSEPGTIVVPIMFHSILRPGLEITDPSQVTTEMFESFMEKAESMDFETITMNELLGFLENNQAIPERSMILMLDDRRPDTPQLFMPYLEANDWTLTLSWPTTDETDDELWKKIEGYVDTGYVDVQSHGHDHIYIQWYTPVEEIEEEIYKPIEVIESHFGFKPIAIIWPGGNFTELSLEMAHDAGLLLGFTVYNRGPLMFNWIPQGDAERAVNDPLLTLPRYWSIEAERALDEAVAIGEAAKTAVEEVKEEELLYYSLFCQSSEGD